MRLVLLCATASALTGQLVQSTVHSDVAFALANNSEAVDSLAKHRGCDVTVGGETLQIRKSVDASGRFSL